MIFVLQEDDYCVHVIVSSKKTLLLREMCLVVISTTLAQSKLILNP